MPFDGIFISNILRELNIAVGSRVDKIYQPSRDELVLALSSRSFTGKLYLSAGGVAPRIHFSKLSFENPLNPPMFCMLMRKHFLNAKLESVVQNGLDRVVTLNFSGYNEMGDTVKLAIITEIMGRQSNIILSADGRIIDAIKRSDPQAEGRLILPGAKYEYPASQNKFDIRYALDNEVIPSVTGNYSDILEGVSPLVSRELTVIAEKSGVANSLSVLRDRIDNGRPFLLKRSDVPFDYSYMPITQYDRVECIEYESFGEMLDDFYRELQKHSQISRRTHDLVKLVNVAIERTSRKIEKQRGELNRCQNNEDLRIYGELIKANIHLIQKGAPFVDVTNYYDPDCKTVRIPLRTELSPSQNAQKYFKDYRKSNTAKELLTDLIRSGEQELIYLGSVLDELSRTETEKELAEIKSELEQSGYIKSRRSDKRDPKPLPPLRFVSDDGFTILVGRNNRQNDQLTLKTAGKNDIWLHTKAVHGTHAIIMTDGKDVPHTTLIEAAILAAYHSDARNSSSVAVDYCPVKHVKKPSGAKPGMVIYENYNTVYVTPDKKIVDKLANLNKV